MHLLGTPHRHHLQTDTEIISAAPLTSSHRSQFTVTSGFGDANGETEVTGNAGCETRQ